MKPSDRVAVGDVAGQPVAFLPRHGSRHTLPPAAINYRANLWAMKELGVERVIGPTAAGSLQAAVRPGDFVVCDQFVDRTWGRADTYFPDGPKVVHVSQKLTGPRSTQSWRSTSRSVAATSAASYVNSTM